MTVVRAFDGALQQVYAAPGQTTNTALEPEESLTGAGPIAAAANAGWIVGNGASGSGTSRRVHILVKPTRPDVAPIEPARPHGPMLKRFILADRGFARARRRPQSGSE